MDRPTLLFSYPCTWVFVDDQESFLESIEMVLPSGRPYRLWENALAASRFVRNLSQNLSALESQEAELVEEDVLVRFNLDHITELATQPQRFSEVSVVVSDYAMPGLDGLELLKQVDDRTVKRVLLTGAADELLAVEAFNQRLIDKFILKSDPLAMEKIIQFAASLEQERFWESQSAVLRYLPETVLTLLSDPSFQDAFDDLLKEERFVEYYFSCAPLGYYCVKDDGGSAFIFLAGEEYLESKLQQVTGGGFPASLRKDMLSKKLVTGVFERPDSAFRDDYDWEYNTIEISKVPGSKSIYWGLHNDPPVSVDFDPTRCSLRSYLLGSQ